MNVNINIPNTLPLWRTPWYLRILGYPAWRFKTDLPVSMDFYTQEIKFNTKWIYCRK